MLITILSAREGWHTNELRRALSERGVDSHVRPYESLVARLGGGGADGCTGDASVARDTDTPFGIQSDAILARIIPNGSLEQIIFRVDALHSLEDRGTLVMNSPRAIERSVDKFYTSSLLEQAGLRTPETVVCERSEDAIAAFRSMRDVIVKPLFGSMGLGMVRLTDEEVAWRVFRTLDAIRGVYYLQRTIDHGGRDVRVFVVGGRVVGAIERHAANHGPPWRTNFSRGGRATVLALPREWEEVALCAANVVGADYAGVDLLPERDGAVYALEVNGIPGWRGVQTATRCDVAGAIVAHLLSRLETGR